MADTDTDETLLAKITELTELEQEDGESAEDFKNRIVLHFKENYPNSDEGNAAFEKLDDDITEWVDAATEVAKNNRGARTKKPLPELAGLKEDAKSKRSSRAKADSDDDEAAGSKGKRAKVAKEKKEPTERKRSPETNRFFRVAEFLVKKPSMTADELVKEAASTKYSERSIRRVHEAFVGITGALKKHDKLK